MKPTLGGNGADPEFPAVSAARPAATSAAGVRERIEEALRLDLVGPGAGPGDRGGDLAEELLPGRVRPSNWYLTGFLVPDQTPPDDRADPDEDADSTAEVAEDAGLLEESADEHRAANADSSRPRWASASWSPKPPASGNSASAEWTFLGADPEEACE